MEAIKSLMDIDLESLIPDLESVVGVLEKVIRVTVLVAPAVMILMGLLYLLAAPREANHSLGYRFFWGMSSVEAWRFMQRLAGAVWAVCGLGLLITILVLGNKNESLQAMDKVWFVVKCVLGEMAVALVSCLVIDITMLIMFNRKGDRRWKKKEKAPKTKKK